MQIDQHTQRQKIVEQLFTVKGDREFEALALSVFNYQIAYNQVYRQYVSLLRIKPAQVDNIYKIPFLPIEIFKKEKIVSYLEKPEIIFKSSGTSGNSKSSHFVKDLSLYNESLLRSFRLFYGSPEEYVFFALLPNYIEQGDSSLIYMMNKLITESKQSKGGFYLKDYNKLFNELNKQHSHKIFLIGVSYALLDFFEKYDLDLKNAIIMETGGMKGRKIEIIREELHEKLKRLTKAKLIHSEYSMTELLSQAYSSDEGIYKSPPWMKIIIRDIQDPFNINLYNVQGCLNIIDLANVDSCSFIASQDIGLKYKNDTFQILGRMDNSEIRGCSLLIN